MSEAEPPVASENVHRPMRHLMAYICVLAVLLLALAAAWYGCPWVLKMRAAAAPGDIAQMQQRLLAVEQQVQMLENRLADMSARGGKEAAAGEAGSAVPSSAPVVAHMQGDLAALSSAVSGLQAGLKADR